MAQKDVGIRINVVCNNCSHRDYIIVCETCDKIVSCRDDVCSTCADGENCLTEYMYHYRRPEKGIDGRVLTLRECDIKYTVCEKCKEV
jgi:hypothetical protein